MITLRHVSASGRFDEMWEYDSGRVVIICVLRGVEFDVPVARSGRERQGAYSLKRLSEHEWQIAPSVFVREKNRAWASKHFPYPGTEIEEFIALSCAPTEISLELEKL